MPEQKTKQSQKEKEIQETFDQDELMDPFIIKSVTRKDIAKIKEITITQALAITDEEMETLAVKMGKVYFENEFWDDVDYCYDTYIAEGETITINPS